jgi:hypothetical protein
MTNDKTTLVLRTVAVFAVLFGVVTIFSGGRVLFGGPEARAAAGHIVPFVLWFNFGTGFAYIVSGIGLIVKQKWAVWLAAFIALATILVFVAFGLHILAGGAYEMRTVGAMALRSLVWVAVAAVGFRAKLNSRGNGI